MLVSTNYDRPILFTNQNSELCVHPHIVGRLWITSISSNSASCTN
nr:MAG TPA: hypothetical protein [Caudoviricetes sp.]